MADDWREELIEAMAKAAWESFKAAVLPADWKQASDVGREFYLREARAALAVAEPVIREQCAEAAATIAKEHLTDTVARLVAAAIREGGKDAAS